MVGFILIFFISCANMQIGFEKDSVFYNGGIVYIYLDDKDNESVKYRVYINGEDTEITLANHAKTRFGVQEGKTTINILDGKKRASIELFLSKANDYYLKIVKKTKNDLSIVQVQKNSIGVDVKNTPLYIDESFIKKQNNEEAKQTISDYGEELIQDQNTSVNENTKTPDNGDSIFYYNAEDGE